jgi:hypothetical protein
MGSGMRRTIASTKQSERRPLTARNSEIDTKTRLLNVAERLFSDRGFILGCVPLWTASGAGSVARQIMGTTAELASVSPDAISLL